MTGPPGEMRMGSRERVLAALRGRPTDRVPVGFDLEPFVGRLRRMGIEDPDARLGVDLKKVWFVPAEPVPAQAPAEPTIGNARQVANYNRWNYFPHQIDRRNPLIGAGSVREVEAYELPGVQGDQDLSRLREAIGAHQRRGFAVAGQIPQLGGVLFETAYRLRGLDNLLEDFRARPALAEALLERIADAAAANAVRLVEAGADIVLLGDDIGTPTSMLISPWLWRRWIKPRLARVIEAARAAAPGVPVAYHSDGYFLPVLGDLIEIGVDILNPVQPDCMDPAAIRRQFGDALALWGTVGAATLMPFAAPEAVRREVRLRVETLGEAGRLILSPAYDLEANVPVENVLAFFLP